jgi:formylglycine-generating enzyme required for sulfatase activity
VRLPRRFAIASTEVTVAQFLKFREKEFLRRYSPGDDCPASSISWYEAAAYCRWLSEQDDVPEDQMCYPPVAEIKAGMLLPTDWHERTGYRLPLEAEWELACRAGVPFSRYCGEGAAMPLQSMWFLKNSDNHTHPVGTLKPNPWGLFDMLGNVAERCHGAYEPYPAAGEVAIVGTTAASDLRIDDEPIRVFRGGNFGDIDANLRAARRAANLPADQWALVGFRPVRTLPQ